MHNLIMLHQLTHSFYELKTAKKIYLYLRSQILECLSIGEYRNISGVPVLPENVISLEKY